MKNKSSKKPERKAVNLYLRQEAIRRLEELQQALRRPSRSNTLEFIIEEAATKLKQAA